MTYGRIAPAHDLLTRHKVAEILAAERAKIVRMLTDVADLKFIAIGDSARAFWRLSGRFAWRCSRRSWNCRIIAHSPRKRTKPRVAAPS